MKKPGLKVGAHRRPWLLWALVVGAILQPALWAEPSLHINLERQTAYLIDNGFLQDASPISSGKPGYATPRGQFQIRAKDLNHLSATYGKIVDGQGNVVISDARSDMRVPSGGRFVPAPMPYYMGFTSKHGLHGGYLPGYPASHGCVRMPQAKARSFFSRVSVGTPVYIF